MARPERIVKKIDEEMQKKDVKHLDKLQLISKLRSEIKNLDRDSAERYIGRALADFGVADSEIDKLAEKIVGEEFSKRPKPQTPEEAEELIAKETSALRELESEKSLTQVMPRKKKPLTVQKQTQAAAVEEIQINERRVMELRVEAGNINDLSERLNVKFKFNNKVYTTPIVITVEPGIYEIDLIETTVNRKEGNYVFETWNKGFTEKTRMIDLRSMNEYLVAKYRLKDDSEKQSVSKSTTTQINNPSTQINVQKQKTIANPPNSSTKVQISQTQPYTGKTQVQNSQTQNSPRPQTAGSPTSYRRQGYESMPTWPPSDSQIYRITRSAGINLDSFAARDDLATQLEIDYPDVPRNVIEVRLSDFFYTYNEIKKEGFAAEYYEQAFEQKEEDRREQQQFLKNPKSGFVSSGVSKAGGFLSGSSYGLSGPERAELMGGAMRTVMFEARRMIKKYARIKYSEIERQVKADIANINSQIKTAETNLREVEAEIKKHEGSKGGGIGSMIEGLAGGEADEVAAVTGALKEGGGDTRILAVKLERAYRLLDDSRKRKEEYAKKEINVLISEIMKREMDAIAANVYDTLLTKRRLDDRQRSALKSFTEEQGKYYAQFYADLAIKSATGKRLKKILDGMKTGAYAGQTFGEGVISIFSTFWDILTGPWTLGTIMVFVMFYFVTVFIEPNPIFTIGAPLVAGLFFFAMNFTSAKTPLDWIAHILGGAISMYEIIIIMYLLGLEGVFA